MPRIERSSLVVLVLGLLAGSAGAQEPIRLARTPDISPDGKSIAFSYLGDIWKVETILEEMHNRLPELARKIDAIVNVMGTPQESAILDEIWPTLTTISIDYGILEKTTNLVVIPVDLGWNDVGNWEQYGSLFPSDVQGVGAVGKHIGLGSQNIFVYNNTPRQVYTIGLEDVIVIEMDDKTVICHKDAVQRVKELAESQQQKA